MPATEIHSPQEPSAQASPRRATRALWTDSGRVLMVAVTSLCIGLVGNHFRRKPLSWNYRPPAMRLADAVRALQPAEVGHEVDPAALAPPVRIVPLEEFRAFVAAGKGNVIDARARAFYQQGHVPGALSLPRETFAADYPRLRGQLDASRASGIVVYCSEADCPDAKLVAQALGRLGYGPARVYREGWEEWSRAGLPQEPPALP